MSDSPDLLRRRLAAIQRLLAGLHGATPSVARRRFLTGTLALAAAPFMASRSSAQSMRERPRFIDYPFQLGVASGTPSHDSVVLWTRLCADPFDGDGGVPAGERIRLRWELAGDESFSDIVQRGDWHAASELGYSVHARPTGLAADRPYWYRFFCGDAVSPTGRTRTLPAPDAMPDRLRFALASCQHFEHGYFHAYRHALADDPHFMAFVGDYIYESSWGAEPVRMHRGGEAHSLADYRVRHAQYRRDPDLAAMHAAVPWLVTIDDHEVDNDWAGDVFEHYDPQFALRRADALQAYFEHMPLPMDSLREGARLDLYRSFDVGRLARFYVLDSRQFRDRHACPRPGMSGSRTITDGECTQRLDASRSLLGVAQEQWLDSAMDTSRARWNVLTQQSLFAPLDWGRDGEAAHYNEGWDGYPAARQRLLQSVRRHRRDNPLVVGGDVHCSWAMDIHADPMRPDSPIVATEFGGTSITSHGRPQAEIERILPRNPHAHFGNSSEHGYLLFDLGSDATEVQLRTVDTTKRRDAGVRTLCRFRVENGRPGVIPA